MTLALASSGACDSNPIAEAHSRLKSHHLFRGHNRSVPAALKNALGMGSRPIARAPRDGSRAPRCCTNSAIWRADEAI